MNQERKKNAWHILQQRKLVKNRPFWFVFFFFLFEFSSSKVTRLVSTDKLHVKSRHMFIVDIWSSNWLVLSERFTWNVSSTCLHSWVILFGPNFEHTLDFLEWLIGSKKSTHAQTFDSCTRKANWPHFKAWMINLSEQLNEFVSRKIQISREKKKRETCDRVYVGQDWNKVQFRTISCGSF